jgi:hypothetical protein
MKRILSVLLLALSALSFTACKEETQNVVIAGDSWAGFTCSYDSLAKAITNAGIKNTSVQPTCVTTIENGTRADNWFDSFAHKTTLTALADPSVKVLYLSLGGNDLMSYWKTSMSAAEEQALYNLTRGYLEKIVKTYHDARPDIKILISGYDYPRFTANHPIPAYKKVYEEMGSPTPLEVNSSLQRFSAELEKVADGKSIFYIQHMGLTHYFVGNKAAGLAPFTTLAPEFISPANDPNRTGGDVNLQSDADAMLQVEPLVTDAFHLNRSGFDKIAEHAVNIYLRDWLKAGTR